RERLRRLDPGGGPIGAEDRHRRAAQRIGQPRGERALRTHDGEIDLVVVGSGDEVRGGGGRNGEVRAELRGAGVAGGGEDLGVGGIALQGPAERVLAAAAPDDQDSHFFLFKASENARAARFAVSTTSSTTAFASFM